MSTQIDENTQIGVVNNLLSKSNFLVTVRNSSLGQVVARPKGKICDMRKHMKKENNIKVGSMVFIEKTDYKIVNSNDCWLIKGILTQSQARALSQEDSRKKEDITKRYSDNFEITEDTEDDIDIDTI